MCVCIGDSVQKHGATGLLLTLVNRKNGSLTGANRSTPTDGFLGSGGATTRRYSFFRPRGFAGHWATSIQKRPEIGKALGNMLAQKTCPFSRAQAEKLAKTVGIESFFLGADLKVPSQQFSYFRASHSHNSYCGHDFRYFSFFRCRDTERTQGISWRVAGRYGRKIHFKFGCHCVEKNDRQAKNS